MEKLICKFRIENEVIEFVINDNNAFSQYFLNEDCDYDSLKEAIENLVIGVDSVYYFCKGLILTKIIEEKVA